GRDGPWVFFNHLEQTFVLSPAANFSAASTQENADGSLESGVSSAITRLPAGFTQWTLLAAGDGINSTLEAWGHALTDLYGQIRRPDGAAVPLNTLGYWTDNGTSCYYRFVPRRGYDCPLFVV